MRYTSLITRSRGRMLSPQNNSLSFRRNRLQRGFISTVFPRGWSGKFITVGPSGKNYTSLAVAINNAKAGDIILCYGTTDWGSTNVTINKKLFIRGMGAATTDTLITNTSSAWSVSVGTGGDLIIENIELSHGYDWRCCYAITGQGVGLANKCHFKSLNSNIYPVEGGGSNSGPSILRNCKITRGYSHLHNQNLAYVSLDKVELNNTLRTYQCSGGLALNDAVSVPTAEYGYNYGNLIIKNEFLAYHGYR